MATKPASAERSNTVLVVDDHDDTRLMYRILLESQGFGIIEAADGEAAIEKALTLAPSCILLDLWLPRIDGLTVITQLRADARTSDTPIIVISGALMNHEAARAYEAGCDDFLAKPVSIDLVIAAIVKVLKPTQMVLAV